MAPNRVLVVDDEPALLGVLQRYLTRLGYDVVTASAGQEACWLFEAEPASYALVMADLSLTDLPCADMLSRMVELNGRLGVVVASGHEVDPESWPETLRDRVVFLQKPFLPKTLADIMRTMLGDGHAGST
jgi:DNA-binding NtrC family response regulator